MRVGQDLRYAVRQLVHTRGFTAIAVLTLALGIAGNTMFYAAVNAMVFRPIRATRTDGLFVVTYIHKGRSSGPPTADQFRRLEANPPDGVARIGAIARFRTPVVIAVPGRAERVDVEAVTAGYPLTLDLVPQAGRMFLPEDDVEDASPAVIISDRLWREWFHGDRAVIGRTPLALNARPFTIVGVAPRGFRGLAGSSYGTADIWITASAAASLDASLSNALFWRGYWMTFVRPKPGVRRAELESAIHGVLAGVPGAPDPAMVVIRLTPAATHVGTDKLTSTAMAIIAMSGLLLLAACANLANMLFARGTRRAGEVAVRLSLGASRFQIFRLFAIESSLIALMAAVLGLALALAATSVIGVAFPSIQSRSFRIFVDLRPDHRVFLYAFGAGGAAALAVGCVTAWRAVAVQPVRALASSAADTATSTRGGALRLGLVAVQVMAAVMLLMSAGLFFRATDKSIDRAVLFDTSALAVGRVDLRMHGYHSAAGQVFFERALRAVGGLPGVEHAALAAGFPAGDYSPPLTVDFRTEKEVKGKEGQIHAIVGASRIVRGGYAGVSPGFLASIGLPLRRGRDISPTDQDTTPYVAVVSDSAARLLWPEQDPVGKRLMFGNDGKWRTVIGVSGDPVAAKVDSPLSSPANFVLIPAAQEYQPEMLIVVRSREPAAQLEPIRGAIRAVDENVAVFDLATADASIMAWAAPYRAAAVLTGSLGLLALTIATLGIYGVIAYIVSMRTREFGIRLALGARPGQLVRMVVDDAVHLLLVGLLAGVFVTAVTERYLQSQRVRFMPNEISTWVAVLAAILMIGIAAAMVPARRAAATDPNVALREL